MWLEHRLSALLQLHHSQLNTWFQRSGQRQLQDEMRIISVLGFGATCIRDFMVTHKIGKCALFCWGYVITFYASAFRRRRHYVFGLSVRPSVRPKPEIPSFDLHMGPLVHPTNRNRFTACPSVRPSVRRGFRAFAGERMEGMAWNFTCWCILTVFRTD